MAKHAYATGFGLLRFQPVQVPAPRVPGILGAFATGHVGGFRFDYILGEDGGILLSEDNNSLIIEKPYTPDINYSVDGIMHGLAAIGHVGSITVPRNEAMTGVTATGHAGTVTKG